MADSRSTSPGPTAPTPKQEPIPLPQIAERADALDRLLSEIQRILKTDDTLDKADRNVDLQAKQIRERALETQDLLSNAPTPLELEAELRFWTSREARVSEQREQLTSQAAKLEKQIHTLGAQRALWQVTWDQVHSVSGLESVSSRIRTELDSIENVSSGLMTRLNFVVNLQNRTSHQNQEIAGIIAECHEARQERRTRLLRLDSPPLWELVKPHDHCQVQQSVVRESFRHSFQGATEFLWAQNSRNFILIFSYSLIVIGIYRLRRSARNLSPPDVPAGSLHAFNRPFSVALLVVLLSTGESLESAPMGINFILHALYIVPLVRVLGPNVNPDIRRFIYVLAGLYVSEGFHLLIQFPLPLRRQIAAAVTLAGLLAFLWLAYGLRLRGNRNVRVVAISVRAALFLLLASLLANIFGFVSLSQVLRFAVVVGLFDAAVLFCGSHTLTFLLQGFLRLSRSRSLPTVHVDRIMRWGSWLLGAGAVVIWCRSMLRLFTVYDTVVGTVSEVLRAPIGFERIQFSLGEVLGLLSILLGGYALANALTFVLKNIVLPKIPLKRGLPYAISTVTYYLLLILVAVAALSTTGVELNKFTVLTGALGVGLGFGLQNIVNNFVSGLILLFERPIHVGDTVDVGGLVGIVRRIGARSSTVVTFQGAEVIVPNSNLLSNQVINWTLSSPWRRVDVPVRIAYGTDPQTIIKLLVRVAGSDPRVLLERPPEAFFLGFGESALNFELRFWSDRQDTWLQLQSDVTVAVSKALQEAGIEIPFPQRDLHLRSVSVAAAESLLSDSRSTSFGPSAREGRVRA